MNVSTDIKDEFIRKVVPGKTFADVGGLWGIVGEKVSVAYASGAASATMIDICPLEDAAWNDFRLRMEELRISDYNCISMDFTDLIASAKLRYDVIHCSGVLYHLPNPFLLLQSLRTSATEHVILTSCVIPPATTNSAGSLTLPEASVLYIPGLKGQELAIMKEHWKGAGQISGITERVKWKLDDTAPWWWLPTPKALCSMCECAGFNVLDQSSTWNNWAYTVLLE